MLPVLSISISSFFLKIWERKRDIPKNKMKDKKVLELETGKEQQL